MKKFTLDYTADIIFTGKKFTPYSINGKSDNAGAAVECAIKSGLNLPAVKDSNGAYDVTDDVPEYGASVKSSAATLVNRPLGDNFDAVTNAYFETVHSKVVWYGILDIAKKTVTVYEMDHAEFLEYLKRFSRFDETRKVIRLNKDAVSKNLHWLEMKSRV
jgi:hypothetical protein